MLFTTALRSPPFSGVAVHTTVMSIAAWHSYRVRRVFVPTVRMYSYTRLMTQQRSCLRGTYAEHRYAFRRATDLYAQQSPTATLYKSFYSAISFTRQTKWAANGNKRPMIIACMGSS